MYEKTDFDEATKTWGKCLFNDDENNLFNLINKNNLIVEDLKRSIKINSYGKTISAEEIRFLFANNWLKHTNLAEHIANDIAYYIKRTPECIKLNKPFIVTGIHKGELNLFSVKIEIKFLVS